MTDTEKFDVIVIGAGPAGYHAAIRCAQLNLRTACIDKSLDSDGNPVLGGTCLNWGCIPSKALLDVSHKYAEVAHDFDHLGLEVKGLNVNLKKMMAFKESVVKNMAGGVKTLFSGNGVKFLAGAGKLLAGCRVEFQPHHCEAQVLSANTIILAPGSVPAHIPPIPMESEWVTDSTGALEFTAVPKHLGIVGAGVIGLELGSVWNRLGSRVILMEALEEFLPAADARISRGALSIFREQGLDIRLGARVIDSRTEKKAIVVEYEDNQGKHRESFDKLIVAVGRKPCVQDLLASDSGVRLDDQGFIQVDEQCRTDTPNVYAIGDAVRGPSLAHKGMEEGLMVAERIVGKCPLVNYELVPNVIYTWPEVAWVGMTEAQLRAAGTEYRQGVFPFAASGRAQAGSSTQGIVKMIADARTDRVMGVHILGPQASELVAQAVIAMEFGASAEDLGLTMFAHPTLSEAVHEAALGIGGHAIHMVNRKQRKE